MLMSDVSVGECLKCRPFLIIVPMLIVANSVSHSSQSSKISPSTPVSKGCLKKTATFQNIQSEKKVTRSKKRHHWSIKSSVALLPII